jgi:hypothetical protein
MKKISIGFLFLLAFVVCVSNASALLVTASCDKDAFQTRTCYEFASTDVAASLTKVDIPIRGTTGGNSVFEYVIPKDARLVGITVSQHVSKLATAGYATYDVTINGTITGLQAGISPSVFSAVGSPGTTGTYLAYSSHDRDTIAMEQGFKLANPNTVYRHDSDNPYGKATPLVAGNRIGVKVTTGSAYAPVTADPVIRVYVVE